MAYSAADIATVEAAILTATVEGVAEVQIGAQRVRTYSLAELQAQLEKMRTPTAAAQPHRGLYFTQLIPPGTG